jgi:arylsulfatase A-like enzyme
MRTRAIGAAIAGGLLAGALVGVVEAVGSWVHAHGVGEMPPVAWALAAYGGVGAAIGLGIGVLAAIVGMEGFGLAFAAIAAVLGFVFARFRIIRDVFLEQAPHGPVAAAVQLGALLAVAIVAFVVWRMLRGADVRRRPLTRPIVAAVVLAIVAGVWTGVVRLRPAASTPAPPARAAAAPGAPNVVLFMVDTLRADHLSAYGYTAITTPHIDALAHDGMRYANAFSQASWTRPSVATILTGLYPSSHGAMHKADILPNRIETLAEVLQQGGYHTVGFANNANVSAAFNFQQGFDEYDYLAPDFFFHADEPAAQLALYSVLRLVRERFFARYVNVHNYYQPAEDVTARVRGWLDGRGTDARPFFAFVHYMDAHDPYMVHPFNGVGYARVANPNPSPAMADTLRKTYDGSIVYLDEHIGALLDDLRRRGLYENTLVILTADHGEEFQEHGGWWHGTTLYDEQVHVPLLLKPPGGGAGRVHEEMATSLDIAPTVIAAAKLTAPAEMQGHALPLDGAAPPARQSVFAEEDLEGNVLHAVRTPQWKLIVANPGNPRGLQPEELYSLAQDPGEKHDVVKSAAAEAEMMRAELGKSILEARAHAGASEQGGGDAATQERLRALGYVN